MIGSVQQLESFTVLSLSLSASDSSLQISQILASLASDHESDSPLHSSLLFDSSSSSSSSNIENNMIQSSKSGIASTPAISHQACTRLPTNDLLGSADQEWLLVYPQSSSSVLQDMQMRAANLQVNTMSRYIDSIGSMISSGTSSASQFFWPESTSSPPLPSPSPPLPSSVASSTATITEM